MKHDEFVGRVQHRARLASRGEAEAAIRATLETLAERLQPESAAHIASQLPPELALHLQSDLPFEHFSLEIFYRLVAKRERSHVEAAVRHVDAVFDTLREALSPGALRKLVAQLPHDYRQLFTHDIALEAMAEELAAKG